MRVLPLEHRGSDDRHTLQLRLQLRLRRPLTRPDALADAYNCGNAESPALTRCQCTAACGSNHCRP